MSTAPSGTGTPCAGHLSASAWWRISRSLWLVLPIFGVGCLGGVALLYVGVRARQPSWWITGLGYLAVALAGFTVIGETDETSTASNWAAGAIVAAWAASIVHACLINPGWLRWQAGRRLPSAQPVVPAMWPGGPHPSVSPGNSTSTPPARALNPDPTHDPDKQPDAASPSPTPQPPTVPPPSNLNPARPPDGSDLPPAASVPHPYYPPPTRAARTRVPWNNRDKDMANWLVTPLITLAIGTITSGCLFYLALMGGALAYDSCTDSCPNGSSFGSWLLITVVVFLLSLAALWLIPWWRGLRRLRYGCAAAIIVTVTISPIFLVTTTY
jgi:hypothetical protein